MKTASFGVQKPSLRPAIRENTGVRNDNKKLTKKLRKQVEKEGYKNIENLDERIAEAIAWGHEQLSSGMTNYVTISSLIARIVKPRNNMALDAMLHIAEIDHMERQADELEINGTNDDETR